MAAKKIPQPVPKKTVETTWDLRKIVSTLFISFISIAMLIMFIFGSSVSSCQASKMVLAEVGNRQVMMGSSLLADMMQNLQQQNKDLPQKQVAMQALDRIIMNLLMLQAADLNGIHVKDRFLKHLLDSYLTQHKIPARNFNQAGFNARQALLNDLREQFQRNALRFDILSAVRVTETQLRIDEMVNGLKARVAAVIVDPATVAAQNTATPAELKAFFSGNSAKYNQRLLASHILIDKEARAAALYKQLSKADKAAFAEAAKKYSLDKTTAVKGGSLDWFFPSDMVGPFAKAAGALQPGTVSTPVKTRFGYHLIRVEQRRNFPSYESLDAEARTALTAAYRRDMQAKLTAKLESGYRKKLQQISDAASKGEPLAVAARKAGLQALVSDWFAFFSAPAGDPRWKQLNAPAVQQQIFSLEKGKSSGVISSGDSLMVIQLLDKKTDRPAYLALGSTNTAAKLSDADRKKLAAEYMKAMSSLSRELQYALYMDWFQSLEKRIPVRRYDNRIQ